MLLFDLLFSSPSQLGYVEVRISQSVSVSPLGFEITRVDCNTDIFPFSPGKHTHQKHLTETLLMSTTTYVFMENKKIYRRGLVTTGCQQTFRSGDNRLSLDQKSGDNRLSLDLKVC